MRQRRVYLDESMQFIPDTTGQKQAEAALRRNRCHHMLQRQRCQSTQVVSVCNLVDRERGSRRGLRRRMEVGVGDRSLANSTVPL